MTPPGESDSTEFVQVTKRQGKIKRVPPAEGPPVVELLLEPNESIISIELTEDWWYGERKTRDWSWTAYIAHRMELRP